MSNVLPDGWSVYRVDDGDSSRLVIVAPDGRRAGFSDSGSVRLFKPGTVPHQTAPSPLRTVDQQWAGSSAHVVFLAPEPLSQRPYLDDVV